jgi:hypothetical protein
MKRSKYSLLLSLMIVRIHRVRYITKPYIRLDNEKSSKY